MKRIITQTIFLWFCMLCGMAYGQTGTLYRVPLQGQDQIVRYDPGTGKHIIYSLSPFGDNLFSITDLAIFTKVKVWNGWNVKYFAILDGLVFFCGDNGSGSGFLGWFDIDSLFYNGGSVYIDQTLSSLGLLTLDNIAVYHDTTGDIRIAGYGLHAHFLPQHGLYRAFEAVGTPATGMQYRTLDLRASGKFSDISDVVVTDNFVVYLHPDRHQKCLPNVGIGITLQPFPKYDMFGNPPFYYHFFQLAYMSTIFAPSYVLSINNDPYNNEVDHIYTRPQMVHSFDDELAVCTYRHDLDDNGWVPGECGTRLPSTVAYITHMKFDLSQLISSTNNPIHMTSYALAKLPDTNTYSIDGLEFDPQTRRYLVLHRHRTAGGADEHALTTFDFPWGGGYPTSVGTTYQTTYNTITQWMPTGMCMDGYVNYMVAGYEQGSYEHILWRNNVGMIGGCVRVEQYPVTTLPLVPEKYHNNEAKPTIWKPLYFIRVDVGGWQEFPCEIKCN